MDAGRSVRRTSTIGFSTGTAQVDNNGRRPLLRAQRYRRQNVFDPSGLRIPNRVVTESLQMAFNAVGTWGVWSAIDRREPCVWHDRAGLRIYAVALVKPRIARAQALTQTALQASGIASSSRGRGPSSCAHWRCCPH